MKQVMMIKFDSLKWRMIDEYKVANPFIEVGFRQVKDVVDAVPAAMNGKPSSKHGSKAVCVLFVLREPFCKAIMILEQLILTCSQNGTMKRTPSGHRAMYRETQ